MDEFIVIIVAMMNIVEILEKVGLNRKEANIYLALLQLGQASVFNIAKKAGLKRPTVYLILDSLVNKGLASLVKTPKATLYSAAPPKKLLHQLKESENNLQKILPDLESIYNLTPNKPRIRVFEGVEGLKSIYSEIIESLSLDREILCYGTIDHLYRPGSEYKNITNSWLKKAGSKNYRIREILNRSLHSSAYLKTKKNTNPNHKVRFVKQGVIFECDNIIYGNKIALFSVEKDIFVTVIESSQITETYRRVFDFIWQNSAR